MLQLIYADLSKEKDYQIFFIILEGFIFYTSDTVVKFMSSHLIIVMFFLCLGQIYIVLHL